MPILETPRLILRPTEESDADAFARFSNEKEFQQYLAAVRSPEENGARVAKWAALNKAAPREQYIWTILKRDDNFIIGNIRFWPEKNSKGVPLPGVVGLGYGLDPAHWGQGYMTEALKAVTAFAHDTLKLHRVEGAALEENPGSWKVMEKAGYQRESALRYRFYGHGKYWPTLYEYASVRPDLLPPNNT